MKENWTKEATEQVHACLSVLQESDFFKAKPEVIEKVIKAISLWDANTEDTQVAAIDALVAAEHICYVIWDDDNEGDEALLEVSWGFIGKLTTALRSTGRWVVDGKSRKWICLDLYVVILDETKLWHLPKEVMSKIERLDTLYIFDKNHLIRSTHLTSIYRLYAFDERIMFKKEANDNDKKSVSFIIDNNGEFEDNYFQERVINEALEKGRVHRIGNPAIGLDTIIFKEKEDSGDDSRVMRIIWEVCRQCKDNPVI